MSDKQGIHLAIELATQRRDALAQCLGLARQQWVSAQMQLDQLESYAQESTARWGAQAGRHQPELMRHHYQFMERLVQAIQMQTGIVGEHAGHVAREAAQVREAEARLEALRQVQAQRDREQLALTMRREQKQSDEMAAAQYRRLRAAGRVGVTG